MKAKILLISTRWIHEPKSIFSNVERCNPNSALKEYFCAVSNSELRKLLVSKRRAQDLTIEGSVEESVILPLTEDKVANIFEMLPTWLQNDTVLNYYYLNDDYSSFLKKILDEIESKRLVEEYKDQKDIFESIIETISPYLKNTHYNTKKEVLTPFIFSKEQDDFAECLDCNAINIDKDMSTGITIADRLSLYKVMEELYEDKERNEQVLFTIYAIWPLGNSNKDKPNDKEQDSVRWVEQLTKAINEECKSNEDIDDIEIILLLHDNDMLSTVKTPLKTVDIDSCPSEVAEKIKRTVAVYQHSNIKFITLVTQDNQKNAKKIYDDARTFIVEDLIFQQLAKLSSYIASYSGSKDNEAIKQNMNWLRKYIKEDHDPHCYLKELDNLYTSCLDYSILSSQCLIDSNHSVNNLIKEIVTPEKYK